VRRFLARLVKLAVLIAVVSVLLQAARRALGGGPRAEPPIEPVWPPVKLDDRSGSNGNGEAPSQIGADEGRGAPAPTEAAATAAAWVAPNDGGTCPPGYPVKVKERSGIFHLPGMLAYDRTAPDRCYASAEAAEADGFRPAKR
jgi:hypothetical protein